MATTMPNVCRCCFAYEDGPPDFKEMKHEPITENSPLQISDFLVLFTGIELDGHQGAMHICPVCEVKLRDAFEFREFVIATNIKCEDEFVIKDEPDSQNDARFSEVYLSEEQMYMEPVVEVEKVNSPSRKKRKPNKAEPETVVDELEPEKSEDLPDSGLNEDAMDIESNYMCPVCDEIIKTYRLLKNHRTSEHGKGVHNRLCPVCQQQTEKGYLKHIVEMHKDYKPQTCAFCSRGFQHAFKLNNHLCTHIEGKKFKCLGCNEAYRE
jgi:Drought induced 19 protein (Di19), zinc-binding